MMMIEKIIYRFYWSHSAVDFGVKGAFCSSLVGELVGSGGAITPSLRMLKNALYMLLGRQDSSPSETSL